MADPFTAVRLLGAASVGATLLMVSVKVLLAEPWSVAVTLMV